MAEPTQQQQQQQHEQQSMVVTREDDDDGHASRPDEYRVTWLNLWNNSLNPKEVSCRLAVDTLFYCFGPAYQLRQIYQNGVPSTCDKQREDVQLCARVKAKQFQSREEMQQLLRQSRDVDIVRDPHVWNFRDAPPSQFTSSAFTSPTSSSLSQHHSAESAQSSSTVESYTSASRT